MSVLTRWLADAPAEAAVEITPESVAVAVLATRRADSVVQGYAIEPMPAGALAASLTGPNMHDRPAVVRTLRAVLERLGGRPRRVALLVPDPVARVSLVRFDRLPPRREDLEQLIRWQVRKSAPFPVDTAVLTHTPGAPAADGGQELVTVLARREAIREYEGVCEEAGMHTGLVDLSTFGLVDLMLAGGDTPAGDWLLVHMQPEYTSLAIMRGDRMIFFRNLAGADTVSLADVVHQSAMYYQDRLSGTAFARVWLGGVGRTAGALDAARRDIEERLETSAHAIDLTRWAPGGAAARTPEVQAVLAPLVGVLLRMRAEAVPA